MTPALLVACFAATALLAEPAAAQELSPASTQALPTLDTEDAELGSVDVGEGRFHLTYSVDVRNGDFVRGSYDDDAADFDQVPFHVLVGGGWELRQDRDGRPDLHLVFRSSNGFHSPAPNEIDTPRTYYESNNVVGLVISPRPGLQVSGSFAYKTSPNGVAGTTNEISGGIGYGSDNGWGRLNPTFVATVRSRGQSGFYTQAGVEPSFGLGEGENAPSLSIPLDIGVGWSDFYEEGSGTRTFGNAGVGFSHPFTAGRTRLEVRAELLAMIRDGRLRRLGGPRADFDTVVPAATLALTVAY